MESPEFVIGCKQVRNLGSLGGEIKCFIEARILARVIRLSSQQKRLRQNAMNTKRNGIIIDKMLGRGDGNLFML